MSVLEVAGIARPAGSYSHAVAVEAPQSLLFVAGQVGVAPDGSLADDAPSQTQVAFDNIGRILADGGMTPSDIVKLTYFVVRTEDLGGIREVIRRNLAEPYPAASLVVVKALGRPEWLIEIDCVAAASQKSEGVR